MVDISKINPLPPVVTDSDQETPQGIATDASHPAQSFADDHLVAKAHAEETAKMRMVLDREIQERPRPIVTAFDKVPQATAHRAVHDDEQLRRLRQRYAHVLRQQKLKMSEHQRVEAIDADLSQNKQQDQGSQQQSHSALDEIAQVFADLVLLEQSVDVLEHAETLTAALGRYVQGALQIQLAMAAGGSGSPHYPKVLLRRLLEKVTLWPSCIPPGQRFTWKETAALEQFLGWALAPPPLPPELLPLEDRLPTTVAAENLEK